MPQQLLSAGGTAPRTAHVWAFLGMLSSIALVTLGMLTASTLATPQGFTWSSLALAGAIVLGHAALFVPTGRIDALMVGSEEAVLVAALLVAPDDVAPAIVLATVLYPIGPRVLGVTERLRRSRLEKLVYNAAAQVLSGTTALVVFRLTATWGLPAVPRALLAATAYFVVSGVLVLAVIRAAQGAWSDAQEARSSFSRSFRAGSAAVVIGLLIGLAAHGSGAPAVFVLGAVSLLYVAARSLARRAIAAETADRLLEAAPHVLAPGDVDAQIVEHACRLLDCETGAITTSPPDDRTALAVPIAGPADVPEYLVVERRLGNHQSFEREDRELLAGLAALAGPARQQRQLVTALERSEASRGAILGALAHDLRSPMAVSSSALQSLAALLARMDMPTAHALVMAADRSNARALRILDELLALEQASLSPGAAGSSDPAVAAERVRETYGELVEVHGGPAVALAVDLRAVGRILDNLVANAVKHAPGSGIHISWQVVGEEALVTVDDDGAGIPAELRAELTGPFRQRDGSSDGVGLGLYLARRFAELAGGRLDIGVSPSGGASMRVFLPLAAATTTPSTTRATASGPSSP